MVSIGLKHFPAQLNILTLSLSLFHWIEFPKLWRGQVKRKQQTKQNIPSGLNSPSCESENKTKQKFHLNTFPWMQLRPLWMPWLNKSRIEKNQNDGRLHNLTYMLTESHWGEVGVQTIINCTFSSDKCQRFCHIVPFSRTRAFKIWHILHDMKHCSLNSCVYLQIRLNLQSQHSTLQKAIFHVCTIYG